MAGIDRGLKKCFSRFESIKSRPTLIPCISRYSRAGTENQSQPRESAENFQAIIMPEKYDTKKRRK
jgi:hypothetical protein